MIYTFMMPPSPERRVRKRLPPDSDDDDIPLIQRKASRTTPRPSTCSPLSSAPSSPTHAPSPDASDEHTSAKTELSSVDTEHAAESSVSNTKAGVFDTENEMSETKNSTVPSVANAAISEIEKNSVDSNSQSVDQREDHLPENTPASEPKPSVHESIWTAFQHKTNGDTAIITDIDDLADSILLNWADLVHESNELRRQSAAIGIQNSISPIQRVFLLEAGSSDADAPSLRYIEPNLTIGEVLQAARPYSHVIKYKREDRACDWLKAFKNLFAIFRSAVKRQPLLAPFSGDAATALPDIENIIAAAEKVDLISTLTITFNALLLKYIKSRTLWHAIAEQPTAWLMIGLKLENENIFSEAFVHLVGLFPNLPTDSPAIPENVLTNIEAKSRALRYRRYDVDANLLQTMLQIGPKSSKTEKPASPFANPAIYHVVNVWRDWISDHLANLKRPDASAFAKTWFCDHSAGGDCLTVSGVYRTISCQGDAYMPADKVIKELYKAEINNWNPKTVQRSLDELKKAAAEIVSPLVQSTLQYTDSDKLPYLTCVDVEQGDIPWAADEDMVMEE